MRDLADKLKTASELLMNKQHIIGLWLNASVSNALKVVDSEYQRLTRPPESVATAAAAPLPRSWTPACPPPPLTPPLPTT